MTQRACLHTVSAHTDILYNTITTIDVSGFGQFSSSTPLFDQIYCSLESKTRGLLSIVVRMWQTRIGYRNYSARQRPVSHRMWDFSKVLPYLTRAWRRASEDGASGLEIKPFSKVSTSVEYAPKNGNVARLTPEA